MDFLTIFILSIVEGVTEFLPISSTGHLILASAWMGIVEDQFVQNFNIVIQFGAILSVIVLYWRRFFPINLLFYSKILVAFLPAAFMGLLFKSIIESFMDQIWIVGLTLFLGGWVLIFFDQKNKVAKFNINSMTYLQAFYLGCIQCLALIPGVSRSGATIIGGLALGLSQKEATEFSFFLGVPTLMAAGLYKGYKAYPTFSNDQLSALVIGTFLSFIFAIIAIRFLISLINKYGIKHFGYYRIALGIAVLSYYFISL